MTPSFNRNLVVVRGAGDVASGVIYRLCKAGFDVIAMEKANPDCVRRRVCFAEAFYQGEMQVEGVTAVLVDSSDQALADMGQSLVPLLIDPNAESLADLQPEAVIDGRMLKQDIDTHIDMAPVVIGLGPGFTAGKNCHAAVETRRGNDLGRFMYDGSPHADTGVPAQVNGISLDRVLRSPADGIFTAGCDIGDMVKQGQVLGNVSGISVIARIDGVVRGIIHDGLTVAAGQKIGDIDPRGIEKLCYTISDKAHAIAEGVLNALLALQEKMARR
jgi:xanthine dehydrogenase accessory factor